MTTKFSSAACAPPGVPLKPKVTVPPAEMSGFQSAPRTVYRDPDWLTTAPFQMELMSPPKSNEASQPLSVSELRFCTATSPVKPEPQSEITLKTALKLPVSDTGSVATGSVATGSVATGSVETGSAGEGPTGASGVVPTLSSMGSPFT